MAKQRITKPHLVIMVPQVGGKGYGPQCAACGGEDCVCCEVYLGAKADREAELENMPADYDEEI